jgi:hypothetical protein
MEVRQFDFGFARSAKGPSGLDNGRRADRTPTGRTR